MQAEGGLNVLELKTNLQEACRYRREGIKKVAMLLCCRRIYHIFKQAPMLRLSHVAYNYVINILHEESFTKIVYLRA